MKLDKRIIKIAIIYDCFDSDDARASIGEKGYFAHFYHCFSDLSKCKFGELQDVIDGNRPYENSGEQFDFFLPDRYVINSGKQYRPFKDTKEFFTKTNFKAGDVLRIYSKTHNTESHLMITGWTDNELILGNLRGLSFNELFTLLELWDGEEGFIPFGVEE